MSKYVYIFGRNDNYSRLNLLFNNWNLPIVSTLFMVISNVSHHPFVLLNTLIAIYYTFLPIVTVEIIIYSVFQKIERLKFKTKKEFLGKNTLSNI